MKRKLRIYPEHECTCRRMTTNRNYCDLCLALYSKPPFVPATPTITAECDYRAGARHRRYESGTLTGE